jgi:hypothetical protein
VLEMVCIGRHEIEFPNRIVTFVHANDIDGAVEEAFIGFF